MRLTVLLLLGALIQVHATGIAQSVTISAKNVPLKSVLQEVKNQTGYLVFYPSRSILKLAESNVVTLDVKQMPLDKFLNLVFNTNSLTYRLEDKTISVLVEPIVVKTEPLVSYEEAIAPASTITGKITDTDGMPVEGATISVQGTKLAATADGQGRFKLDGVPDKARLVITSVGFTPLTIVVQGKSVSVAAGSKSDPASGASAFMDQNGSISVKLAKLVKDIEAVVVTGIYSRSKESFTGSAATYTQEELKRAGGTNVLQSLKTIDPAFAIRDNPLIGSDPNRLPNLEIRGKSSVLGMRDDLAVDPNQPLFILDGFESTISAINDLDINRIESITILKDAASTAIYGSKAANGVVVVETVKPKAGKLQVSYNGNANISAPDLTSYNLMDASEKLQFEFLAGRYDAGIVETPYRTETELELTQMYNNRLRSVAEGVNTYWLAEPLRVGLSQKHSLYVMGGEGNFMFGLGGGYNGITGVMKESKRSVTNGNIDLIYRVAKFQFSNKFTVASTQFGNPVVSFNEYAQSNPYYRKRTNEGQAEQWLEYTDDVQIVNPVWNASLNSRNKGNNLLLSNYFVSEWSPSNEWRVRARFGITADNNENELFYSPEDTRQILNKPVPRRGEFNYTGTKGNKFEGDMTVSYAKLLNGHRINLVAGSNVISHKTLLQGYAAEGFPPGNFAYPNFAAGYTLNEKPTYLETVNRSLNGYFNTGYAYDDRYLMDLSLRSSGSSIFGNSRQFNTTWSLGLGWNIHRERFIQESAPWISFMKIRSSIGNPGNQNFESGGTLLTYAFPNGVDNYFGLGALPDQIGNPNLQWQITNDKNIGFDLTVLDRRFSLNFDYFYKVTNPLLISIDMPLSSGTQQYFTNAGQQISKGLLFSSSYQIIRDTKRRILWSVRANGRTQKVVIDQIGEKLKTFNEAGRGTSTVRYYDGADPDDIWVVRSAGIDPATGKEIFFTKDGKFTYDYSYDDEVIAGNLRPEIEGILGSSFTYRGFTLSLNFRYQLGTDVYNAAVSRKVENVNLNNNQDRRALYERWHSPGDIRRFKNIRDVNASPMSSRFVQRENSLILESLYMDYEFMNGWIKKVGLGNLRVFASVRDAFRLSTIRVERGIDYPFARVIDAGLSLNF